MPFKPVSRALDNNLFSIKSKRSQSALEYMMTYGWAILIIVIVAVILYSMGIFNPSSSVTFTSTGFTPFTISSTICNSIGLKLGIVAGPIPAGANSITVSKVYISSATGANTTTASYALTNPVTLKSGQTAVIFMPNIACNSAGIKYSFSGNLQYGYSTTAGKVVENTTGTIAGTVSASVNSFTEYNLPANAQWTVEYSGVNHTSTSASMTMDSRYNSTWKIYPVDSNGVTYYPIYAGGNNISTSYNLEVDFIPMRNLWFSNNGAANVSMIYYNNNTLAKNNGLAGLILVGTNPDGLAITLNNKYIYVINTISNTVSVISTSSNSVVSTISVGINPYGVAITPNGQYVYVTNTGSSSVSVISASSNSVIATIPVVSGPGPTGVAITPNGQYVYVTDNAGNSVSVISASSNSVITNISVGPWPYGVAITPNGQYAYVTNEHSNTVSVISTSSNSVVSTISVGNNPLGVAITPNGQYVYVDNAGSNTTSVISTSSNSVIATISVGAQPTGITITPNGQYAYVTNWHNGQGGNSISVISTSSNSVVNTITGTPSAPCGINYGPLGSICA